MRYVGTCICDVVLGDVTMNSVLYDGMMIEYNCEIEEVNSIVAGNISPFIRW